MTSLTILAETTLRGAGLLGEHGLAYWLDTGTHRVLFAIHRLWSEFPAACIEIHAGLRLGLPSSV
jgi:hypothetical protein